MQEAFAFDKILAPTLPSTRLYRERLSRTLIEAITPVPSSQSLPYKLILLCAPAGYGKTILLVDTVQHISIPCCWYFLDSADTDLPRFFQFLFASIRRCYPTFGVHLDTSFSDITGQAEPVYWLNLLDTLLDALKAEISEPFLLALCNYHEVNRNLIINRLVNHLLAHLPKQVSLVIESRAMPALELAPLIAHRQMLGLGSQKLSFTAQEVYDLAHLQNTTTIALEEAEKIARTYEGWIAGILLGSSLGYSYLSFQGALYRNKNPLQAYVMNEIFAHERATYEFLKDISILARPTAAHCNALLEINDAEQRLNYAEQQGLFLTRDEGGDNQATVYLCHPLLLAHFQEELHSHSPERYLALHNRAAQLFLVEQAYECALTHALQAREYRLAADILHEIANAYIAHNGTKAVKEWLSLFPEELLSEDPRLLLILADIHEVSGEKQQLASFLDTIERLLQKETSESSSTLSFSWAELYILRAKLLFNRNVFQRAQELCQKALTLLPADQRLLRIKALQCLGVGLLLRTQDISQAIVHLQHALQLSNLQYEKAQIAVLHRQLGTAYSWQGNYTLAEHHQKRALSIWEQMDNPRGIIYSLITLGQLKRRQGFTQEAETLLTQALSLSHEPHQFDSGKAYALEGLGELACDLDQYEKALTYLEDSLTIARELNDTYLFHCNLCHLATVHAFIGDIQTAQFLLSQITLKEQEQSSYERLMQNLAQGSTFLVQCAYEQAQENLEHAVLLTEQANIQFLHIRALVNLAVCYLRQGKKRKALQISKQILELNKQNDHDHSLQIEAGRFPELQALLDQASRKEKIKQKALETRLLPAEEVMLFQNEQQFPLLRIRAFGEPQVFSNGVLVTRWRMARTMELYFFLLEKGCPQRKEQIILALWPDAEGEKVDQLFRTTVYYLRKAIGEEYLEYASGLYHLNLSRFHEEHLWYDVALFEHYSSEAKKALEQENGTAAITAFAQMIDLYKGDYLQPFYSDWCIFRRDQLREMYIDAHHQLASLCWQHGDVEASLQHWQQLLALDPCFEEAHYGIMRYYFHQGKRELALRQYQLCCRTLREELQAPPGLAIQKLYQHILEGSLHE